MSSDNDDLQHPRYFNYRNKRNIINQFQVVSSFLTSEECLELRKSELYTSIEKFKVYERSNALAYELAIRNKRVKQILEENEQRLREPSVHESKYQEEAKEQFYIDIEETLNYEIQWKVKRLDVENNTLNINSITPEYSRPQLITSSADNSSLFQMKLNMSISKEEVLSFFRELSSRYEVYQENKNRFWGNEEFINSILHSKFKLTSTVGKVKRKNKEAATLLVKLALPQEIKSIAYANMLFAYDMRIGYNMKFVRIAEILHEYNAHLIKEYNPNLSNSFYTMLAATPDATKYIPKVIKQVSDLVNNCTYKQLITPPKHTV